jgi:flagellar motility protein MotE (MotC chaperone)
MVMRFLIHQMCQMFWMKDARSVLLNWSSRQKAAEIKKRRSAPKKELKKLEDDIKERLYQEETERVKKLRDLHDNAMNTLLAAPAPAVAKNSSSVTSFERRCSHLDDLVKELYFF